MVIPKRSIASAVKRFPLALITVHSLWRLTRPRFTAGVIGVVFNALGEVLVVEHVYHTSPQWGLPGGYVDRGEDPEQTLAREFREELELVVTVGPVVAAQRAYNSHLDLAYLCQTQGEIGSLCGELSDFRWALPNDLPEIRSFHRRAISQALVLMEAAL